MTQTKKYELFCDFDSTAANSIKRLVEMLNEKFNKKAIWHEIKRYSASDLFPDATEEDVLGVFAEKRFFDNLDLFEGFIDVMKKYENVFNYHIATIGTKSNLENKKVYMEKTFPFKYIYDGLEKNGTGKEDIQMHGGVFIDDHIANLKSSNAKVKILFRGGIETDWNTIDESSKEESEFLIADTWQDVDDILSFMLKIRLLEV